MSSESNGIVLQARALRKSFARESGATVRALADVSLQIGEGTLAALVGPDGAGKTTLIRLAAGLLAPDDGELRVLGIDVAADPQQVQDRISYMPQKFGLYEDLTVQENLDLYADLHGVSAKERSERYPGLMEMTALGPFTARLAGRLSGGMKQKLGLACTLVRAPELLLLDEPTVGVDPLSRRELWEIVFKLVHEQGLTVLLSTSYLDEAERCHYAVVMHQGRVLAQGAPEEVSALARERAFLADPPPGLKAREFQGRLLEHAQITDAVPQGGRVRLVLEEAVDKSNGHSLPAMVACSTLTAVQPRFEDGFMVLVKRAAEETGRQGGKETDTAAWKSGDGKTDNETRRPGDGNAGDQARRQRDKETGSVVQVRDLVRQFGSFTAVDHVSFDVQRGEIFGLLGPNGAGKTTTFRMLCGLLPASSGSLRVAGMDLRRARASARQKIGYVAQKFSLYGQLSVGENLDFFASAYSLRGARRRERLQWALEQFDLASFAGLPAAGLPGGFKQRLAMAAALLHEPETLFLDEPTSGADPLARREFWRRITAFSEQGVTVVITTHFMEEAEYCDRIAIMDAGQILAQGTPAEIRRRARPGGTTEPDMEDAFIAIVEEARDRAESPQHASGAAA